MTIGNLFTALRQGYILRNPATWKNRTVAINALVAVIGAVLGIAGEFGHALNIGDDVIGAAALVIWGVFNAWSTVATTDKIGLRPKDGDVGVDGPSGGSGAYP